MHDFFDISRSVGHKGHTKVTMFIKLPVKASSTDHDANQALFEWGHGANQALLQWGHDANHTLLQWGHDANHTLLEWGHNANFARVVS